MKKIIAMLLILTLALSLAACGSNDADTIVETTLPSESDTLVDESATNDADAVSLTESESATDASAVTESASQATDSTTAKTDETTAAAALQTKEEILEAYNAATANVIKKKVAFSKNRQTGDEVYNAGLALKAFKDTVFGFMGIGSENIYAREVAKNDDNYSRYIKESTLTAADITNATCTVSDGSYIITISVKGGSSSVTDGGSIKNNSPIDKSGISAGENDKDYYDHKTAQNVFDAIDEIASGATIKESYSNAVVKATVDIETGNLTALTVTFDIAFDISKVLGSSGTATGTTTITYKNFKW